MDYEQKTIKEIISKINNSKMFLPAIQRKFVWKPEQITDLFDSIMRGYPIGTFLFWNMDNYDEIKNYTFYKFILHYNEYDSYENELAPRPLIREEDKNKIDGLIGVLDGQQRISALFLALQGTYAYRKRGGNKNEIKSYPIRKLFLNILKDPSVNNDDTDNLYEFRFLTDKEAERTIDEYWFEVREYLEWTSLNNVNQEVDKILQENIELAEQKSILITNLTTLYERFGSKLINYCEVDNSSLDDVLEIFIRVNNAGTTLSKTDLLLSTIIANWEDGRKEFEAFLKELNINKYFNFNNDVIMKTCLCLIGKPIKFEVKNFSKEVVNDIKLNWQKIKHSVLKTAELLKEYGFSDKTLTSYNAIIPIAYYIYEGGVLDAKSKNEIKKYLVIALIQQIFGRAADSVIKNFRDILAQEKTFDKLMKSKKLERNESFEINNDLLEDILQMKKGPYTFMVLTLLYPNLKYSQIEFHQDHLHPASSFTDARLQDEGIDKEKWEKWQELKDTLPNLQILEEVENKIKSKMPLKEWILMVINEDNITNFLKQNYIQEVTSLEFKDFDVFYEQRKKDIKARLEDILLNKQ